MVHSPGSAPPPAASATAAKRLRFNPFSDQFRIDPYRVYRTLREREPMHRVMGMWVLTRYADIVTVLRDRRFSSSLIPNAIRKHKPKAASAGFDPIEGFIAKAIVFTENPDHVRLRRLVNGCFNAEAVAAERAHVEALVERLLDPLLAAGGMEAMEDYADPIPLHVTCDRIGLPMELRPSVRQWTHHVRFLLDPSLMTPADYAKVDSVLRDFMDALRPILDERRRRPGEDLVSRLLAARSGGDRLNDEEVILTCIMSFVAGHETTKYLIGNSLLAMAEHPGQYALLRREPGRIEAAIDEVLRFDPPLQQTKRLALEDIELGGEMVRAGDSLLLCLGAGNRDPARFPDPDRFDIGRDDPAHLALGYGMRACLGGALAHMEAEVALAAIARRVERIELAEPEAELDWQNHSRILRGLRRLPLRLSGVTQPGRPR